MRGTFANIRIRNHMLGPNGKEGGYTIHYPSKEEMSIYDAAMKYKAEGVPLLSSPVSNMVTALPATGRQRVPICLASRL